MQYGIVFLTSVAVANACLNEEFQGGVDETCSACLKESFMADQQCPPGDKCEIIPFDDVVKFTINDNKCAELEVKCDHRLARTVTDELGQTKTINDLQKNMTSSIKYECDSERKWKTIVDGTDTNEATKVMCYKPGCTTCDISAINPNWCPAETECKMVLPEIIPSPIGDDCLEVSIDCEEFDGTATFLLANGDKFSIRFGVTLTVSCNSSGYFHFVPRNSIVVGATCVL